MSRIFRSPLSILAAVLLLRSAGFAFGILNIDEADFALLGSGIARGMLPFRDLVDIKPPLAYLTYLPAYLTGRVQLWPMRILGVLWVFATAMLLRAAVERWLATREPDLAGDAGWAAAWLYLLAILCEIPSLSGELLLNLPQAGALYFFARATSARPGRDGSRRRWFVFASGLCAALASLYKHQGAVIAGAFGVALLAGALLPEQVSHDSRKLSHASFAAKPGRAIADGALLTLGFALPWVLCFAIYAGLHDLPDFIEWVFTRNFAYASQHVAGQGPVLPRFAHALLLCCGATIVPWVLALNQCDRSAREGELKRDRFSLAATLLLWMTWLAVSAGGRFYEHYFLQFAPPLAIVAARPLAGLARGFSGLNRWVKTALMLGCALPFLGLTGYSWARGMIGAYPEQEPRSKVVAAFLDANSDPRETLFVWGHYAPIYLMANRFPGTRYIHTSEQMGNFDPQMLPESFDARLFRSEPDVQRLLADLQTRKPALIVDTAPADIHEWHKIPLSAFPELLGYIESHYAVIGHPAGAVVYRRNGS